jgi:hypothetical protein
MNTLEFALRCLDMGWHVLPIIDVARDLASPAGKRGKRPAPWLVPHGVLDATTDVNAVRQWFADADLGVGIACGPSGLLVVDVDPRHGGDFALSELVVDRDGSLPHTPSVFTGGGGIHYFYRGPADVKLRPKLAQGVDLQGAGRYIVAPPSLHESGRRYEWDRAALPSVTAVADLPEWIVDVARVVEAPPIVMPPGLPRGGDLIDRACKWLARCEPSIQGSNGSAALMHATAGLTRGFALEEDVALSLLSSDFNPTCQPPWSMRELLHAVISTRKSTKPVGYLRDAPRRVDDVWARLRRYHEAAE